MIGSQLGPYRIIEKLGEGGMGVVYLAWDTRLFRQVAIKVLPPQLVPEEKVRRRFIKEARAASALNHPNICTVHDIGEQENIHFIVMEFIDGETLRSILEVKGSLPEAEVVDIGIKICEALKAAHSKGIIHRDIKPDNVMVTREGYLKVMDFGLAKLAKEAVESISNTNYVIEQLFGSQQNEMPDEIRATLGGLLGTASYMSPEQVENSAIDHRADIFSLGVSIYELLTGALPFKGNNVTDTLQNILKEEPDSRVIEIEKISPQMAKVIKRMLKKNPDERFRNMEEVLQELTAIKEKKYSKTGEKQRIRSDEETENGQSVPRLLHRSFYMAGFLIFFVLLLMTFAGFSNSILFIQNKLASVGIVKKPVKPPNDSFVIAVAPFWGVDEEASIEGKVMQTLIERNIQLELGSLPNIKIIGKNSVKIIHSYDEAKLSAKSLGAHIIVWGEVICLRGEIEFQPFITFVKPFYPFSQKQPDVLNVSLSQPKQIELRKAKAADVGNIILNVAAFYYYQLREYRKALNICHKISQPSIESRNLEGNILLFLDQEERAEKVFRQIIDLDPHYAAAYSGLGLIYQKNGNLKEAVLAFEKAVNLEPGTSIFHSNLGNIYSKVAMVQKAISELNKAIDLDSLNAVHFERLGRIYSEQKQYDLAIKNFQKAIDLKHPKIADIQYWIGIAYHNEGNYAAAEAAYRKTLSLRPNHVWAIHGLGSICLHQGKFDKSLSFFHRALALNKNNPWHHLNAMGVVWEIQGEWEKALPFYKKTTELNPGGISNHLNYYFALRKCGKIRESSSYLQHVYKNFNPNDHLFHLAGFLLGAAPIEEVFTGELNENEIVQRQHECELFCYLGMAFLLGIPAQPGMAQPDSLKAKYYFQKCIDTGIREYTEYEFAWAALKKLQSVS